MYSFKVFETTVEIYKDDLFLFETEHYTFEDLIGLSDMLVAVGEDEEKAIDIASKMHKEYYSKIE